MKVLITASTVPRWDGDAVPRFIVDQALAIMQAQPDIRVSILAPHDRGAARQEVVDGVALRRFRYFWPEAAQKLAYPAILPNLRRKPWLWIQVPFFLLAEFMAVVKECRRERPDYIYSHWFAPQALAGAVAAGWLDIPHVITSHASDVQVMRRLPLLGAAIVRAICRRAHAITAVSRRTQSKLRGFFNDADWQRLCEKVAIIPMGVAVTGADPSLSARYTTSRRALQVGDAPMLLFVGRLTEKKGIPVLLEAMVMLRERGVAATLLIGGDGEDRESIEHAVDRLGLVESVRLLGFIAGDIKQQCLDAADIFVVPSIETDSGDAEGLPVSLLEGLAAGKICIATDVSGADDIVTDGVEGIIVPPNDTASLANAIEQVLSWAADERQAMQRAALKLATRFAWPSVAQVHIEHLFSDSDSRAFDR